jgi:hypothetical protein
MDRVSKRVRSSKEGAPWDVQQSRCKLLHEFFYLSTVGCTTYAEPCPAPSVLRVGHDAHDVLHVWTWAVYGPMDAYEGVLAEVLRAGNCHGHGPG